MKIIAFLLVFLFHSLAFSNPVLLDNMPAYDQGPFPWCTYVAEASIFGYWDMHGYPNLFEASAPDIFLTENVWSEIVEMRSMHTLYLEDSMEDFAESRGYVFSATLHAPDRPHLYPPYTFETIVNEIDQGRPVWLSSRGFVELGDVGHATPVFGYDKRPDGNYIGYYMNWSEEETVLWRPFPQIDYKDSLVTVVPVTAPDGFDNFYFVAPAPVGDDVNNSGIAPDSPFETIEHAIDAAHGSEVIQAIIKVAAGTYTENIVMDSYESIEGGWNSDFSQRWDFKNNGLEPTAEYKTIIDGGGVGPCIYLDNLSGVSIEGVTIQNGNADSGGGIYSDNSSLTLSYSKVTGNSAVRGGAIHVHSSYGTPQVVPVTITHCDISENSATYGGGITCYNNGHVTISNSIISENTAYRGGALRLDSASKIIVTNSTISDNTATNSGGGIFGDYGSINITLINSILWNDTPQEIRVTSGQVLATYSDIQGGYSGEGNIDADPQFVGPGDYHLTKGSPCKDAGDNNAPDLPSKDIDGESRIIDGIIDMGADEYFARICKADFNDDKIVDEEDLLIFSFAMGEIDCTWWPPLCDCDIEGDDNDIDGADLAVLAAEFGRNDCP